MLQEVIQDRKTNHAMGRVEWLTVERAGYGLAVVIALGVRLWGLGAIALGPTEAVQALPAVASVNGVFPDLSGVSPLLYVLQRVTFLLFGASDGTARFWPALLGGLSPALFFFLRRQLTPGGALTAAFLWAVSPLGVWSSRLSLGDSLTPTLALALVAIIAWEGRGRTHLPCPPATQSSGQGASGSAARTPSSSEASGSMAQVRVAALGLAAGLLFVSGSNAYTALLAIAAAALVWASELGAFWSAVRSQGRFALVGVLATVLIATFFLAEPAGLAAGVELVGRWVSDLIPGRGEYSALEILSRLLLSELFVLAFGLAGMIWSLRNRDCTGVWLGIATGLALAVVLIGRGRDPVDLSLVSLGLTLLAGPAVSRFLGNAYGCRRERDPWLLALVSLALLLAAAIAIPSSLNATNNAEWRSLYSGVGVATLIMSLIIWVVYGVWESWGVVVRALPVVPLVFGLAWQVSSLVSLSYDRGAGRQPGIVHVSPASDLFDLQRELRNLSALSGGGGWEANVDVAWPTLASDPVAPMLRWQFRNFPYARFSASIPTDPAPLVLTPVEDQPRLDGYSGAEFAVLQRWTTAQLPDFASTLRWILYREALTPPEKTRLILWVNKAEK